MVSSYAELGGLRWGKVPNGSINASWPLARLRATPSQIEIRVLIFRKFVLRRHEIHVIRKERGIFSTGVRFDRGNQQCPAYLLFWTLSGDRLMSRLAELGYPTTTGPR